MVTLSAGKDILGERNEYWASYSTLDALNLGSYNENDCGNTIVSTEQKPHNSGADLESTKERGDLVSCTGYRVS